MDWICPCAIIIMHKDFKTFTIYDINISTCLYSWNVSLHIKQIGYCEKHKMVQLQTHAWEPTRKADSEISFLFKLFLSKFFYFLCPIIIQSQMADSFILQRICKISTSVNGRSDHWDQFCWRQLRNLDNIGIFKICL